MVGISTAFAGPGFLITWTAARIAQSAKDIIFSCLSSTLIFMTELYENRSALDTGRGRKMLQFLKKFDSYLKRRGPNAANVRPLKTLFCKSQGYFLFFLGSPVDGFNHLQTL